jgi:hypothetical protein
MHQPERLFHDEIEGAYRPVGCRLAGTPQDDALSPTENLFQVHLRQFFILWPASLTPTVFHEISG